MTTWLPDGGGGGGGGGDATAANQTTMIAELASIDGGVDGLEALVGITNASLATLTGLTNPTIVTEAFTADEGIAAANWLWGYSLRETSGTDPARVTIHNGDANSDPVIAFVDLAAGESPTEVFPRRVPAPDGIFVEVVSGAAVGTVFYEA